MSTTAKTVIVPPSVSASIHARIDELLDRLKVCPACGQDNRCIPESPQDEARSHS